MQARENDRREGGRRKGWVFFGAPCSRRGCTQTSVFVFAVHVIEGGRAALPYMPEFTSFAFHCPVPLASFRTNVGTNANAVKQGSPEKQ